MTKNGQSRKRSAFTTCAAPAASAWRSGLAQVLTAATKPRKSTCALETSIHPWVTKPQVDADRPHAKDQDSLADSDDEYVVLTPPSTPRPRHPGLEIPPPDQDRTAESSGVSNKVYIAQSLSSDRPFAHSLSPTLEHPHVAVLKQTIQELCDFHKAKFETLRGPYFTVAAAQSQDEDDDWFVQAALQYSTVERNTLLAGPDTGQTAMPVPARSLAHIGTLNPSIAHDSDTML